LRLTIRTRVFTPGNHVSIGLPLRARPRQAVLEGGEGSSHRNRHQRPPLTSGAPGPSSTSPTCPPRPARSTVACEESSAAAAAFRFGDLRALVASRRPSARRPHLSCVSCAGRCSASPTQEAQRLCRGAGERVADLVVQFDHPQGPLLGVVCSTALGCRRGAASRLRATATAPRLTLRNTLIICTHQIAKAGVSPTTSRCRIRCALHGAWVAHPAFRYPARSGHPPRAAQHGIGVAAACLTMGGSTNSGSCGTRPIPAARPDPARSDSSAVSSASLASNSAIRSAIPQHRSPLCARIVVECAR